MAANGKEKNGPSLSAKAKKALYSADQRVQAELQDESSQGNPFGDLYKVAVHRLDYTRRVLSSLIRGEPLLMGASTGEAKEEKWVTKFLMRIVDAGLIPEHLQAYIQYQRKEPVLGFNPGPQAVIAADRELNTRFAPAGVTVRVLGTHRYLSDTRIKDLQRASNVLVAVPGDFKATLELTDVLERKLKLANKNIPPLVIENNETIIDGLLANWQILEYDNQHPKSEAARRTFLDFDKLKKEYGIWITHDRDETIKVVNELHARRSLPEHQEAPAPMPFITEGATVFVATGTRKKYNELRGMYEKQGLKVNILPIDFLVDTYISPKEESESYEGNAAEKVQAALDSWRKMGTAACSERLATLGKKLHEMGRRDTDAPLKEEEIFVLGEDSGFHFNPAAGAYLNIGLEAEFAEIGHKINPLAPFPGVNTGPNILAKFGVATFFKNAEQVLQRLQQAHKTYFKREVVKKSVLAVAQLHPPEGYDQRTSKKRMLMYSAQTKGEFTTDPKPADGAMEIDNFLIPLENNPNHKNEAALGKEWTDSHSPRALAWQALMHDVGLKENPGFKLLPLHEKTFEVGVVADESYHPGKRAIHELQTKAQEHGMVLKDLSSAVRELADVQEKMLEHADSIVLAFDPERAKQDFWRNLWIFSSLIVGEQTRDKYKLDKPLYLINPGGVFDDFKHLAWDLHRLGTIAQDPDTLFKCVDSVEQAVEALKQDRKNYLQYYPPAYSRGEKIYQEEGERADKDEFKVAIFISATNENSEISNIATQLVDKLAEQGITYFYSGAGLYSGMGSVTKRLVGLRDSHQAHHTGITTPHIMDGQEVQGKDIASQLQNFRVCRDIYQRIEQLLEADGSIIAPGGMGTVQELAGYAFLKQLALKEPDNPYVKGRGFDKKELVILNTQVTLGDGSHRGFYEALCTMLDKNVTKSELDDMGIHIVDNVEEAVNAMVLLREKMGKAPPAHQEALAAQRIAGAGYDGRATAG